MRYMILTALLFLVGCSGLHHVSGQRFMEKAEQPAGSMYCTSYIGDAGGSVYLQEWSMSLIGPDRTNVLWTDKSELTAANLRKLAELKAADEKLAKPQ